MKKAMKRGNVIYKNFRGDIEGMLLALDLYESFEDEELENLERISKNLGVAFDDSCIVTRMRERSRVIGLGILLPRLAIFLREVRNERREVIKKIKSYFSQKEKERIKFLKNLENLVEVLYETGLKIQLLNLIIHAKNDYVAKSFIQSILEEGSFSLDVRDPRSHWLYWLVLGKLEKNGSALITQLKKDIGALPNSETYLTKVDEYLENSYAKVNILVKELKAMLQRGRKLYNGKKYVEHV